MNEEGDEWSDDLLTIRKDKLDEDVETHSKRVRVWGHHWARAKAAVKQAEARKKLVAAELAQQIRSDWGSWGFEKSPSVDAVKAEVEASPQYATAVQEVIDAELEADYLEINYWALRDRGEQISNMVKLHGQMYWAKPDTSISPAVSERAQIQAGRAAAEEIKPRRRRTES